MPKDKPELKLIARGEPSGEAVKRTARIMAQIYFRLEREERERRKAEKAREGA
ncbi:MAG: hypothetical protein WC364_14820 [Eubacteriales bacterium]|jgi:hypothetical protein